MNNREDYLDSLLNSVATPDQEQEDMGWDVQGVEEDFLNTQDTEDDFLKRFDQEMEGIDETSFLKEFEMELDGNKEAPKPLEQQNEAASFETDNIMVNTIENDEFEQSEPNSFLDADMDLELEPESEEEFNSDISVGEDMDLDALLSAAMEQPISEEAGNKKMAEPAEEEMSELEMISDDQDILDMLSGLEADDDLADIGNLLKAHDEDEMVQGDDLLDISDGLSDELGQLDELSDDNDEDVLATEDEEDASKKKKGKKKRKKEKDSETEKKEGFLQKLSKTFFGEDDEDAVQIPEEGQLENISDENREVLKDLEQDKKRAKKKEQLEKKEQKKKDKEEKKKENEGKKKEKEQKRAEKQAQKPKKEKQPKEKSKPLPKVPVILIFVMAISIIIMVNLFSNMVGYSTGLDLAKSYYDKGNYVEAYGALSGIKIKEADQNFYDKAKLTAIIQKDWNSYEAYQKKEMYPEALNTLICGVGRYDKNINDAREAGVESEYEAIMVKIQEALNLQFSVSVDQAREIYGQYEREEYTVQLYKLLDTVGLRE